MKPQGIQGKAGGKENYKVSIPNNSRNETAAQIPILAKNPSATAAKIKRAANLINRKNPLYCISYPFKSAQS